MLNKFMFKKEKNIENFNNAETVIGASIKVKGNFTGQGNVIVEGKLEGSLKTSSNLLIGSAAILLANIEASEAVINGEVQGSIKVKKYLSIGKTAKITGDIKCGEISIERGALINGQLIINSDSSNTEEKKDNGSEKKS